MLLVLNGDGSVTKSISSAQYNGDKYRGQNANWVVFDTDANEFVKYSYGALSKRCATLYHTSAIARACVNKPNVYAIGEGLVFRSAIDADFLGLSKDAAKEWSRRFSQLLHLEKIESGWYGKSNMLDRESRITGDAVLYFLREKDDEKPFDLIPCGGHEIDWEISSGNYVLGIEVDDYSRRKGFKNTKGKEISFRDSDNNQIAIQYMRAERAGQIRGLSAYYSEIGRSKSFDRMWDAVVERMVQEAIQLGYANTDTTDLRAQAERMARKETGKTTSEGITDISGGTPMTPGNMYMLKNGESITLQDMKTPSNNFGAGNQWTLNMFGMASGYAPEFLLSTYSTSFTAHKGAFNDVWKKIKQERTSHITQVENVINMEYLKHFAKTGQIEVVPGFWNDYKIRNAYCAGSYLGPVPGHINPLQEINADIKAIDAGVQTKEQVSAKFGIDFWPMLDEMTAQYLAWESKTADDQADTLIANNNAMDKEAKVDPDNLKDEKKAASHKIFGLGKTLKSEDTQNIVPDASRNSQDTELTNLEKKTPLRSFFSRREK